MQGSIHGFGARSQPWQCRALPAAAAPCRAFEGAAPLYNPMRTVLFQRRHQHQVQNNAISTSSPPLAAVPPPVEVTGSCAAAVGSCAALRLVAALLLATRALRQDSQPLSPAAAAHHAHMPSLCLASWKAAGRREGGVGRLSRTAMWPATPPLLTTAADVCLYSTPRGKALWNTLAAERTAPIRVQGRVGGRWGLQHTCVRTNVCGTVCLHLCNRALQLHQLLGRLALLLRGACASTL